ncbi:hypothetical protein C8Q76DRAFT_612097 [Earliella scabrosa]|nr:hypothetical protein C8Q76DRAFT_612097 [Earliella scabrosa]
MEVGLDDLTRFLNHVLPLALGHDVTNPTPLQTVMLARPDHYLPFRELATCRQRVSGPGGPYHKDRRDLPGAFPSWLIFRALLFDSPVMRERTLGYFKNHEAWLAFLEEEGYQANNRASENRFFNVSAYGSPQNQRRAHGLEYAKQYFEEEGKWLQLTVDGTPVFRKIPYVNLPLVGKLTGYLLAADLVYASKVQAPTLQELALVIRRNDLGSLRGLRTANQLSDSDGQPSYAEVDAAFQRVYHHLENALSPEVRRRIGFDGIMVEHLLCKFQRTKDKDRIVE